MMGNDYILHQCMKTSTALFCFISRQKQERSEPRGEDGNKKMPLKHSEADRMIAASLGSHNLASIKYEKKNG